MFENFIHESNIYDSSLRTKLEIMRKESELVVYRFNDMRDWTMLNRGNFQKLNMPFSLDQKLHDVLRIMNQYAQHKEINIIVDFDFENTEG